MAGQVLPPASGLVSTLPGSVGLSDCGVRGPSWGSPTAAKALVLSSTPSTQRTWGKVQTSVPWGGAAFLFLPSPSEKPLAPSKVVLWTFQKTEFLPFSSQRGLGWGSGP